MAVHKLYTFINITGLAVGLTAFILILLYIQYEFSYESQHHKAEKVYRVNLTQNHPNGAYKIASTMVPLGPVLKNTVPAVLDFIRIETAGKTMVSFQDKKFYEKEIIFTDQGFFNLFTIQVLAGNKETALANKFSVVLTQSNAEKYFGEQNPLGQTLNFDDQFSVTVTAVIADFPKNTHIDPGFLISFETIRDLTNDAFMNNWVTTRLETYLLLDESQPVASVEKDINAVLLRQGESEVERILTLEQLSRIHLYSDVTPFGDIRNVRIFLAIGILILVIASINFMNLSTARSSRRSKEVGLRKVVGATQWQLIIQFLSESVLVSLIALVLAIFLLVNVLPLFRDLTGQPLALPPFGDWPFYGMLLVITLIVGILSGSYPALYLSSFSPISVLKGRQTSGGKNTNLRRVLVVLQFSIAIALIISTLSISNQLDYMRNKKLGFKKDQIVVVPVMGENFREDTDAFKQELRRDANIIAVSGSILLPSRIGMYNNVTWEGAQENESIALIQNKVDYDFLDTYEIEIVNGRNFSREHASDIADYRRENVNGAMILNEEAVKRFGWKDPINKQVIQTFGTQRFYFNVIGVIKDFHFTSLHKKIQPLSLFLRPANPSNFSIKISTGDIQNTIAHIRKTWEKFNPKFPFEYYFLDETFGQTYLVEEKMQTLFSSFSLLSIFISCLGLLGLAAFAAEQRTKEIGIRKVLGASISNILLLLSREFTKWVFIANLIAWPCAWLYLNSWVDAFAYRAELAWWIFFIAAGLALFIALITVSSQVLKTAMANPVKSLRYE